MIYYTTTKTDCLLSLMQCISNGSAKFWFSDTVPFSKFHDVLPKLILEYGLDLTESERKKKSDYGEPVWSLVINYDPAKALEQLKEMRASLDALEDGKMFTDIHSHDFNEHPVAGGIFDHLTALRTKFNQTERELLKKIDEKAA